MKLAQRLTLLALLVAPFAGCQSRPGLEDWLAGADQALVDVHGAVVIPGPPPPGAFTPDLVLAATDRVGERIAACPGHEAQSAVAAQSVANELRQDGAGGLVRFADCADQLWPLEEVQVRAPLASMFDPAWREIPSHAQLLAWVAVGREDGPGGMVLLRRATWFLIRDGSGCKYPRCGVTKLSLPLPRDLRAGDADRVIDALEPLLARARDLDRAPLARALETALDALHDGRGIDDETRDRIVRLVLLDLGRIAPALVYSPLL